LLEKIAFGQKTYAAFNDHVVHGISKLHKFSEQTGSDKGQLLDKTMSLQIGLISISKKTKNFRYTKLSEAY